MQRHDWPTYLSQPRTTSPSPTFDVIFDPASFPPDPTPPSVPSVPTPPPPPHLTHVPTDTLTLPTPNLNSAPPLSNPSAPALPSTSNLPAPPSLPLANHLPPTGPLQPTTRDNFRPPAHVPRRPHLSPTQLARLQISPQPHFTMPANADDLSPAQRRELRRQLRRVRGVNRRTRVRSPADLPLDPARIGPADRPPERRRTMTAEGVDKKTARVIRNREVALRARQAAKAKLHNLESENSSLRNRASDLEHENSTLKRQIESLRHGVNSQLWPQQDVALEGVVHSINR